MYKLRLQALIVLLALLPVIMYAQNNTNSPYTRFGYGKLAENAFGNQRAMGGIGIGLRDSKSINPLNPASFSAIDSMTFMFDFGLMGQMAWFEDESNKSRKENAGLEYIALQFPITKNLGMGIGFEPVSYVGYEYGGTDSLVHNTGISSEQYYGSGGLSKFYTSLSYDFFDRLSVGVNLGYLFGDIIDNRLSSFSNSSNYSVLWTDSLRVSGFVYKFGVQYHQTIGKDKDLTIGLIYSPKTKISGTVKEWEQRLSGSSTIQSYDYYTTKDSVFQMPESFGFGVSLSKRNKYTIGADVQYQRWADAKFFSKTDSLSNNLKINLGGEYIPDAQSNNGFKRIRYRAGAYYSDSYVNVGGEGYKEYGLTLGFGFPMSDRRSFINVAFDYTSIRPEASWMVDEKYLKLTVSYTFNELWFFKRKIQ